MTEVADPQAQQGGQQGSTVAQAQEKVQEKAQEVKSQAGGRLREELDTRSTQAGEQVESVSQAMRRTADSLREEGKEGPAGMVEQITSRLERVGGYLREADADRMLTGAEDFARRRPWAVAAGAGIVGFVASRFLKASSTQRYQAGQSEQRFASPGMASYGGGMGPDVDPYVTPELPTGAGYAGPEVPAGPGYGTPDVPVTAVDAPLGRETGA